jgi:hypothetical protein
MAWELEHQEQVGVEEEGRRPLRLKQGLPGGRRLLLYAAMAMLPLALFGLMLLLARH